MGSDAVYSSLGFSMQGLISHLNLSDSQGQKSNLGINYEYEVGPVSLKTTKTHKVKGNRQI